jgi:hypothetical protein
LKPGSARLLAEGAVSVWRFGSGSGDGVRMPTVALPPLGPGHHHIDLPAAAAGADEPLAPVRYCRLGTIPAGLLGRVGFALVTAGFTHDDELHASGGRIALRQSNPRSAICGMTSQPMTTAASEKGTLAQNIQRQPSVASGTPPVKGPC